MKKIPFAFRKKPARRPEAGSVQAAKNASASALSQNVPRVEDIISPSSLAVYPNCVSAGGVYEQILVLNTYPRELYLGWLENVFASIGDLEYTVHVYPVPAREVINDIVGKITKAESQYIVDLQRGNQYRLGELQTVIADLNALRDAIHQNLDRMYYVTCVIAVKARDPIVLEQKIETLRNLLARSGADARVLRFKQLESFISHLPTGDNRLNVMRNLNAGGVASMLPVTAPEWSHSSGILLGYSLTESPVFYDAFFGPPKLAAPHMVCIGYTGSGKSMSIGQLAMRECAAGHRIVFIDPEGRKGFVRMVRAMGGTVIRIDPSEPPVLNLFEIEPELQEDGTARIDILSKVAEIRGLMSVIYRSIGKELSQKDIVYIEETVQEEYAERGITADPESLYEHADISADGRARVHRQKKELPTISSFRKRLITKPGMADELGVLLQSFQAGGSLGMFDCQSSVDLTARMICFDISGIRDEFARLYAMYVILGWVWQKFAQTQPAVKKRIIIDEAWQFMKYQETAEFSEMLARKGRRHNTAITFASQSIREFLETSQGLAVMGNCPTVLLLRPHSTQMGMIQEHFGLSQGAMEYLSQVSVGEGLLIVGNEMTAVRFRPNPVEADLLETDPNKLAARSEFSFAQTGGGEEW